MVRGIFWIDNIKNTLATALVKMQTFINKCKKIFSLVRTGAQPIRTQTSAAMMKQPIQTVPRGQALSGSVPLPGWSALLCKGWFPLSVALNPEVWQLHAELRSRCTLSPGFCLMIPNPSPSQSHSSMGCFTLTLPWTADPMATLVLAAHSPVGLISQQMHYSLLPRVLQLASAWVPRLIKQGREPPAFSVHTYRWCLCSISMVSLSKVNTLQLHSLSR